VAFARYADEESGRCWPALEQLARDLRVSVPTVKRLLRVLKALGLVDSDYRQGPVPNKGRNAGRADRRPNLYTVRAVPEQVNVTPRSDEDDRSGTTPRLEERQVNADPSYDRSEMAVRQVRNGGNDRSTLTRKPSTELSTEPPLGIHGSHRPSNPRPILGSGAVLVGEQQPQTKADPVEAVARVEYTLYAATHRVADPSVLRKAIRLRVARKATELGPSATIQQLAEAEADRLPSRCPVCNATDARIDCSCSKRGDRCPYQSVLAPEAPPNSPPRSKLIPLAPPEALRELDETTRTLASGLHVDADRPRPGRTGESEEVDRLLAAFPGATEVNPDGAETPPDDEDDDDSRFGGAHHDDPLPRRPDDLSSL
jgi:hypothetical protein